MKNPWNIQMKLDKNDLEYFEEYKEDIAQWFEDVWKITTSKYRINVFNKTFRKEWLEYIDYFYNKKEYGIKILAREFKISYSILRKVLQDYSGLKFRSGQNVVTNRVKIFRSMRVQGDKSPFKEWPKNPNFNNKGYGISGYYKRKDGKYIWLRSTWEYIYAKWLDQQNIIWEREPKYFQLKSGKSYLPDFRINQNGVIYYVEVKSKYYNSSEDRLKKFRSMKREYPQYNFILVDSIESYTNIGYINELKEWKKERISKLKFQELNP